MTSWCIKFCRAVSGLSVLVSLLACSGNGSQMPAGQAAPPPIQSVPGGNAGPSAAPAGALPVPPVGAGRSGTYAGIMEPLSTGGGAINCMHSIQVTGWHVHGDRVRFGSFHGTIDAAGGVQMAYGGDWITGQFEGQTFRGEVSSFGGRFGPGCAFTLSLHRVGP